MNIINEQISLRISKGLVEYAIHSRETMNSILNALSAKEYMALCQVYEMFQSMKTIDIFVLYERNFLKINEILFTNSWNHKLTFTRHSVISSSSISWTLFCGTMTSLIKEIRCKHMALTGKNNKFSTRCNSPKYLR